MRFAFWLATLAGSLLCANGLLFVAAPTLPESVEVRGVLLEGWYVGQVYWAFVIGLAAGSLLGWYAIRSLHHAPREDSRTFSRRVRVRAVLAVLTGSIVVGLVSIVMAAVNTELIPTSAFERATSLIVAYKYWQVIGAAMSSSAVGFLLTTWLTAWGGTYSLLPTRLSRSGSTRGA